MLSDLEAAWSSFPATDALSPGWMCQDLYSDMVYWRIQFPVPEKLEHGVVFLGALILGFKNLSRKSFVSTDYFYVKAALKLSGLK